MMKKLLFIFILALGFRFWNFYESIYFAYDQARDAYISQTIYKESDLKLIGPPVSGATNLFHGPLFWYLLAPVNLLFRGDPVLVAVIFRIINALGIFVVFAIVRKMFSKNTALMASFIYAVSFEQTQYAMYVGNPVLANLVIPLIFLGVVYRSAPVVFGAAALVTQFNLMYIYTFGLATVLAILFRLRNYKIGILITTIFLSSFIVAEIAYGFRGIKTAFNVLRLGYDNVAADQTRLSLYWDKYLVMYKDNILINQWIVIPVTIWLITKIKKSKSYLLLFFWIFGWVFLMMLGGHTTYYTNAGLGLGVIILGAVILSKLNKFLFIIILGIIVWGNTKRVIEQAPKSLISGIAAQEMMKLADEYRVIDKMYEYANGRSFTVSQTGIPYDVQTLWAYLFNNYGLKKFGYLPNWENRNTLGYPGFLPEPKQGTDCIRFRLVEPKRGLPQKLIDEDLKTENYFSWVVETKWFGEFLLEIRQAKDKDCTTQKSLQTR